MPQVKYGDSPSEDHQFIRGIPVYAICEVVDKIMKGNTGPPLLINGVKRNMPTVRILEAELFPTLLSKARSFGLSNKWVLVSSLTYLLHVSCTYCRLDNDLLRN